MQLWDQVLQDIITTRWYVWVAVIAGIASVWFSSRESIWVYPVGLVNTITFVYISFESHLLGEATVNLYYTVMSIYGWVLWARKDRATHQTLLHISFSNREEWIRQLAFFGLLYLAFFFALSYARQVFFEGVLPAADAFATATAFTGMWLMAKKKVESWWWWIATNIASIPLYFVKNLALTSLQYVVLLVMAVAGLISWMKKARENNKRHVVL